MLGSLILYLKGMGRMMFQVSGFYYKGVSGLALCCLLCFVLPLRLTNCWKGIRESRRASEKLKVNP